MSRNNLFILKNGYDHCDTYFNFSIVFVVFHCNLVLLVLECSTVINLYFVFNQINTKAKLC